MLRPPTTLPGPRSSQPPRGLIFAAWIGLPAGAVIAGIATAQASWVTDERATAHFALLWSGILLALLPAAAAIMHPGTRRTDRRLLVLGVAVLTVLPKLLSYPGGPSYFDEYAHWSQIERLTNDGLAFMPNQQVVVVGDFPAMHLLATALHHMTGISTSHIGIASLFVFHALTLLGVGSIAERVSGSSQVGGAASLWYAVGPGLWFFHSQFAYESFGVVLFVWSLVSITHFVSSRSHDTDRDQWMILGLAISATLVATHHLSSYINALVLGTFVIAVAAKRIVRRETSTNLAEVATYVGCVLAMTFWWYLTQAPNTRAYLEPYIRQSVTEATRLSASSDANQPAAQRELFAGSTIPFYEQLLSFATPFLSAGVFGLAVLAQIKRGLKATGAFAMAIAGAGYFAVFPLMLSEAGAEGARRSWSFTNAGVAVVVGLAIVSIARRPALWQYRLGMTGLLGVLAAVLIGNTAISSNEEYRLPGAYRYGSDTRSRTAEMDAAADWLKATQGPNQPFIGDRTAQVTFSMRARVILAVPSDAFPVWNFVIAEQPLTDAQLSSFSSNDARFIALDRHQTVEIPQIGFYLDHNEPLANERTEPLSDGSLTKYDGVPWAQRIYSSDTFELYRVLPDVFGMHPADLVGNEP